MADQAGSFDSAEEEPVPARWPNWRAARILHGELPSTQDEAKQLLLEGNRPPLLIQALRQTAGRGRGGNRWSADEGALAFTLVFAPATLSLTRQNLPTLAIATALAVCESLQRFSPEPLGIKWPNDVYAAGRKLCGILIESLPTPGGGQPVVLVGVGVNVNNDVPQDELVGRTAPISLATLAEGTIDSSNGFDNVLALLLPALEREYRALAKRDAEQVRRWNARSVFAGKRCRIQLPGTPAYLEGVAEAIDGDGALTLITAEGRTTVRSGSVVEW